MMTTQEIAVQLVEWCRQGEWERAQRALYHEDVISIEPEETGGHTTQGLDKLLAKNEMWADMTDEIHSWEVSDPLVADGYFACTMTMDVTLKKGGRIKSTELCIYKVEDGKVVSERFMHA